MTLPNNAAVVYVMSMTNSATGESFYKMGVTTNPTARYTNIASNTGGQYFMTRLEEMLVDDKAEALKIEARFAKLLEDFRHTPAVAGWCGSNECYTVQPFKKLRTLGELVGIHLPTHKAHLGYCAHRAA